MAAVSYEYMIMCMQRGVGQPQYVQTLTDACIRMCPLQRLWAAGNPRGVEKADCSVGRSRQAKTNDMQSPADARDATATRAFDTTGTRRDTTREAIL